MGAKTGKVTRSPDNLLLHQPILQVWRPSLADKCLVVMFTPFRGCNNSCSLTAYCRRRKTTATVVILSHDCSFKQKGVGLLKKRVQAHVVVALHHCFLLPRNFICSHNRLPHGEHISFCILTPHNHPTSCASCDHATIIFCSHGIPCLYNVL